MLLIYSPVSHYESRQYIYKVILQEFLGLDFQIIPGQSPCIRICLQDDREDKSLYVSDEFFSKPLNDWGSLNSLPRQPLKMWNASKKNSSMLITTVIPIIYGVDRDGEWIEEKTGEEYHIHIDIFGSSFFMLTRYEEYVKGVYDEHGRFPVTASLAYQERFLDRPIVNEYTEILWYGMKRLWPQLERKPRSFAIKPGHDIDVPYLMIDMPLSRISRICLGDLLKRRNTGLALDRYKNWVDTVMRDQYWKDPYYTYDIIFKIGEQYGIASTFNFKTACTNPKYDKKYSPRHPWIRGIIKRVHDHGHNIGFHPSYDTYMDIHELQTEFDILKETCEELAIHQTEWEGRQHYLRWRNPETWRIWDMTGLQVDSTLGYPEQAGFRCGTCYEYPTYDLAQNKEMKLKERPLIVMDSSLLSKQYMNLTEYQALEYVEMLKQRCKKVKGMFTVLWHNGSLINQNSIDLYQAVMRC